MAYRVKLKLRKPLSTVCKIGSPSPVPATQPWPREGTPRSPEPDVIYHRKTPTVPKPKPQSTVRKIGSPSPVPATQPWPGEGTPRSPDPDVIYHRKTPTVPKPKPQNNYMQISSSSNGSSRSSSSSSTASSSPALVRSEADEDPLPPTAKQWATNKPKQAKAKAKPKRAQSSIHQFTSSSEDSEDFANAKFTPTSAGRLARRSNASCQSNTVTGRDFQPTSSSQCRKRKTPATPRSQKRDTSKRRIFLDECDNVSTSEDETPELIPPSQQPLKCRGRFSKLSVKKRIKEMVVKDLQETSDSEDDYQVSHFSLKSSLSANNTCISSSLKPSDKKYKSPKHSQTGTGHEKYKSPKHSQTGTGHKKYKSPKHSQTGTGHEKEASGTVQGLRHSVCKKSLYPLPDLQSVDPKQSHSEKNRYCSHYSTDSDETTYISPPHANAVTKGEAFQACSDHNSVISDNGLSKSRAEAKRLTATDYSTEDAVNLISLSSGGESDKEVLALAQGKEHNVKECAVILWDIMKEPLTASEARLRKQALRNLPAGHFDRCRMYSDNDTSNDANQLSNDELMSYNDSPVERLWLSPLRRSQCQGMLTAALDRTPLRTAAKTSSFSGFQCSEAGETASEVSAKMGETGQVQAKDTSAQGFAVRQDDCDTTAVETRPGACGGIIVLAPVIFENTGEAVVVPTTYHETGGIVDDSIKGASHPSDAACVSDELIVCDQPLSTESPGGLDDFSTETLPIEDASASPGMITCTMESNQGSAVSHLRIIGQVSYCAPSEQRAEVDICDKLASIQCDISENPSKLEASVKVEPGDACSATAGQGIVPKYLLEKPATSMSSPALNVKEHEEEQVSLCSPASPEPDRPPHEDMLYSMEDSIILITDDSEEDVFGPLLTQNNFSYLNTDEDTDDDAPLFKLGVNHDIIERVFNEEESNEETVQVDVTESSYAPPVSMVSTPATDCMPDPNLREFEECDEWILMPDFLEQVDSVVATELKKVQACEVDYEAGNSVTCAQPGSVCKGSIADERMLGQTTDEFAGLSESEDAITAKGSIVDEQMLGQTTDEFAGLSESEDAITAKGSIVDEQMLGQTTDEFAGLSESEGAITAQDFMEYVSTEATDTCGVLDMDSSDSAKAIPPAGQVNMKESVEAYQLSNNETKESYNKRPMRRLLLSPLKRSQCQGMLIAALDRTPLHTAAKTSSFLGYQSSEAGETDHADSDASAKMGETGQVQVTVASSQGFEVSVTKAAPVEILDQVTGTSTLIVNNYNNEETQEFDVAWESAASSEDNIPVVGASRIQASSSSNDLVCSSKSPAPILHVLSDSASDRASLIEEYEDEATALSCDLEMDQLPTSQLSLFLTDQFCSSPKKPPTHASLTDTLPAHNVYDFNSEEEHEEGLSTKTPRSPDKKLVSSSLNRKRLILKTPRCSPARHRKTPSRIGHSPKEKLSGKSASVTKQNSPRRKTFISSLFAKDKFYPASTVKLKDTVPPSANPSIVSTMQEARIDALRINEKCLNRSRKASGSVPKVHSSSPRHVSHSISRAKEQLQQRTRQLKAQVAATGSAGEKPWSRMVKKSASQASRTSLPETSCLEAKAEDSKMRQQGSRMKGPHSPKVDTCSERRKLSRKKPSKKSDMVKPHDSLPNILKVNGNHSPSVSKLQAKKLPRIPKVSKKTYPNLADDKQAKCPGAEVREEKNPKADVKQPKDYKGSTKDSTQTKATVTMVTASMQPLDRLLPVQHVQLEPVASVPNKDQPPQVITSLPSKDTFSLNDLLKKVLSWSPSWFEEHEKIRHPPPVVKQSAIFPLLESYDSHSDYLNIMLPLMLLEAWESTYNDWKSKRDQRRTLTHMVYPVFLKTNIAGVANKTFMDLHCQAVLSRSDVERGYVKASDLVIVELKIKQMDGLSTKPVIGLVQSAVLLDKRKAGQISPAVAASMKNPSQRVLHMEIKLLYKQVPMADSEHFNVQVLTSLVPLLRQQAGLSYLQKTLLMRDILRPSQEQVFMCPHVTDTSELQKSFNGSQALVIASIAAAVLQPYALPKICLLQGPPGTGKSLTIIGLVKAILTQAVERRCKNPRILLCAPSNAAIDELTRRLSGCRIQVKDRSRQVNYVRCGPQYSMHADVQAVSFDTLCNRHTEKFLEQLAGATLPSVRTALKEINSKIETCRQSRENAANLENMPQKKKWTEEIEKLKQRKSSITKQGGERLSAREEARLQREVLLQCDVVCATLCGSGSTKLVNLLTQTTKDVPFTAVIVDEACQSVELDTLIPLQYGASKLVLVGDPEQLPPTVLSKTAQDMNYNQSLFERLYNHFRLRPVQLSPIQMLQVQYRMHPEICHFPNHHVYAGKLSTDRDVAVKREKFTLKPYIVYDVSYSQEQQEGQSSICNPLEAEFTVRVCVYMLRRVHGLQQDSIGIITPYQKMRQLLKDQLCQRECSGVEVGTVDGFQGREKDIIILSCVRARSNTGNIGFLADRRRLNVSLTRAKYCLCVVGHLASLQVDAEWNSLIKDARQRRLVYTVRSRHEGEAIISQSCAKAAERRPSEHRYRPGHRHKRHDGADK